MLNGLISFVKGHKIAVAALALIIAGGGYAYRRYGTADVSDVKYVLAAAAKETVVTAVSGTGQVSASDQIDIKPKVSGRVVAVGVKAGQKIKAGTVIARLDDGDAQKSYRDAVDDLETAKLALQRLKEPADELSVMQSQNSLASARLTRQNAVEDLEKAYEDAYNEISNTFLSLPSVMTDLNGILYGTDVSSGQQSNIDYYADVAVRYDEASDALKKSANDSYAAARSAYDKNLLDYKSASRYASRETIDALLVETYDTSRLVSEAAKNATNLIQFYKDKLTEHNLSPKTLANTHLSTLNSDTTKVNGLISGLLGVQRTIDNDEASILSADRTIAEREASLAKLQDDPDALDVRSAELTIKQRQYSLQDASDALVDYVIRAPFDGTIAALDVEKGDDVSPSAALATLITDDSVVEVELNEIDMSRVAVGQNATLTFDAIEGLAVVGKVADIDALGAVSQGVVTYGVRISFDAQDARVKPGMSSTAAIITEARAGVLTVPNSAVKTSNGAKYVLMFDGLESGQTELTTSEAPRKQAVETGIASDSLTEIIDGLDEGDMVVVKSITASASSAAGKTPASAAAQRATGGFGIPGMSGRP